MKGSRQQANIYRLEGSMVVGEAAIKTAPELKLVNWISVSMDKQCRVSFKAAM